MMILLLQAPFKAISLYSDKAKLCPDLDSEHICDWIRNCKIRLIMPRYYGGYHPMLLDFHKIKQLGDNLLVPGIVGEDSQFLTLVEDVDLPEEVKSMVSFGQGLIISVSKLVSVQNLDAWCCVSRIAMGWRAASIFSYTSAKFIQAFVSWCWYVSLCHK